MIPKRDSVEGSVEEGPLDDLGPASAEYQTLQVLPLVLNDLFNGILGVFWMAILAWMRTE